MSESWDTKSLDTSWTTFFLHASQNHQSGCILYTLGSAKISAPKPVWKGSPQRNVYIWKLSWDDGQEPTAFHTTDQTSYGQNPCWTIRLNKHVKIYKGSCPCTACKLIAMGAKATMKQDATGTSWNFMKPFKALAPRDWLMPKLQWKKSFTRDSWTFRSQGFTMVAAAMIGHS